VPPWIIGMLDIEFAFADVENDAPLTTAILGQNCRKDHARNRSTRYRLRNHWIWGLLNKEATPPHPRVPVFPFFK
jgi:hypothetical protein